MTRHFIYYDADGQVQAKSSSANEPAETSYERSGNTRLEVTAAEFAAIDRDTKVTVTGDVIDTTERSVNAVQPSVDPNAARLAELSTKVVAGVATLTEALEYLTITDGLA